MKKGSRNRRALSIKTPECIHEKLSLHSESNLQHDVVKVSSGVSLNGETKTASDTARTHDVSNDYRSCKRLQGAQLLKLGDHKTSHLILATGCIETKNKRENGRAYSKISSSLSRPDVEKVEISDRPDRLLR